MYCLFPIKYFKRKSRNFIELMNESKTETNDTVIMIIFSFQRISLLFEIDKFAEKPYVDFKLQILEQLLNWFTLQSPIQLIESSNLNKILSYIICIYLWMIITIIFTKLQLKYSLRIFFTYYQLIVLMPIIKHLNNQIYDDFVISIINYFGIFICYILYFLVNRNYLLPQQNEFLRRYTYFNFVLIIIDVVLLMIVKSQVNEFILSILLILMNLLFLIDSFIIRPYCNEINQKYVNATSLMFFISLIKLVSFKISQTEVFYFILILSPLLVLIIKQLYRQQINKLVYNSQMSQEKMLAIIDILNSTKTNQIYLYSVLWNVEQKHGICIENENLLQRVQQTVLNLMNLVIEQIKTKDWIVMENLQLYKIMYIINQCKKTQLGYIELKHYMTNSKKQSFYFTVISNILQEKMAQKNKRIQSGDKEKKLQLSDIRKAELLYEDNLSLMIQILDTKIKFWIELDKGYQRIEDFAQSTYNLSQKIWQLRDTFFSWFEIQPMKLQTRLTHFNILELKLLGILYSAILNDYHSTLDIEQRIDEIMQFERNVQNDDVNNLTIFNNELIMIATSFAKQKSLILNRNRGQLAEFFGYKDEKDFQNILYIEQLMPTYIQQIHDKIIQRYMKKGYSLLIEHSKEVYVKMKNNFIKPVNISLLHMFENEADYIVTGALQKVKQSQEFLIFDRQGKILGISEQIFGILGQGFTLEQLLNKGYVYFWFQDIFEQIYQEKQLLLQQSELLTRGIPKTHIICPINNFNLLCQDHDYTKINSTVKIHESQNYFTEVNETDQQNYLTYANINSIHFLKEQNISFINEFLQKFNQTKYLDQNTQYSIKFQLQFNVLGGDILSQFILQIYDIEKVNKKKSINNPSTSYFSRMKKTVSSDPFNESDFKLDYEGINKSISFNPPIINKINQVANQDIDESQKKQSYLYENQQQQQLVSPRGNQEILINREYDEEEDDEDQKQAYEIAKSSSQQNQNKQNVEQVIQQYKELELEFKDNAKQSQSSATSDRTQMSVFNILRNLQYTQRYQTTLIKVFFNTTFLFLILLLSVILQLIIARGNTNNLQHQIPLVRLPDKFNRLYCTFTVLGQIDLEMRLLGFNHGDYYAYRIQQESDQIRVQLLELIVEIEKEFSVLEQKGKLNQAEILIVNQFIYSAYNISFLQFNQMVNEYTQALDKLLDQNDELSITNEQVRLLFMKANLNNLIDFVGNVVENIVTEFFTNIDNYQFLYLIFLFVQLIIIIIAILLQFKLWTEPYIYKQNILLMICRVQEKDVELLLLKYKSFKDILVNEISKWRQINYFKEFFTCRISQLRKIQKLTHQHQIDKKLQKSQQRAKLNQRIQETQYSIMHIYLMLFFLWFILTSYVLSSYLFQNINIIDSLPELNLCMKFVRFKQRFDSCMIISQLVKNQNLLSEQQKKSKIYFQNPEYNKTNGFFQQNIKILLVQFQTSLNLQKEQYNQIYDNIVASRKISAKNKNLLLGLYQDDLCDYIGDQLPFCNYQNGKFKYFPDFPQPFEINNNRERLKQGFNGLYQEIQALFSSKFVKELNGELESDVDEIINFLQSAENLQLLMPYFFDLNKAIVEFYSTIISTSVDILETDYQNYLIYYIIFGLLVSGILFAVVIFETRKLQRQIRAIRQALILLPHESLLDVQIYNAIKRFEQKM
ncbi:unnamed protein product [Paramecium sonneborni]|uniref:Uncharacterized protein n=1 Tax=Paramecium sonneborni TaxID=65129 RepID=A0A8S1QYL1_9CILI|nr:unnamed protein product [Paramecium sonneborni]